MKHLIFFLTFVCAMVATTASAQQKGWRPYVLRGDTVILLAQTSGQDTCTCSAFGMDFAGKVKVPIRIKNGDCKSFVWLTACKKRKMTPREAPETLPVVQPAVQSQNIDNRKCFNLVINKQCCDTKKEPILATAQVSGFVELDLSSPVNREYKEIVPIVRVGAEVESYLVKQPGIKFNLQANAVAIPSAFLIAESCPSCVPQTPESVIGLQIRGAVKWQVGRKFTITGYVRSNTRLVTKREVQALPDQGVGLQADFGKPNGLVNWHLGGNTGKSNSSIYAGVTARGLFAKRETRKVYAPGKLTRG